VSFYPLETAVLAYETPVQKVFSGFVHPVNLMLYQFDVLGRFISLSVKEKNAEPLGDAVSGPVGIYNVVGTMVAIPDMKERILQLLNLTGLLSLSLAFFNVLPIPALDGGRLFFILIEGVTRRKVSPKFEAMAHTIGMAVLLTLILLVTFKDIFQLFR
jgi:regulator of sigma E protease